VDGLTIVALAGAALIAVVIIGTLWLRFARLSRAADDAIERIGAPPRRRWWPRAEALTASVDRLEAASADVRRERAKLAGALQSAGLGILITDDDGVITFANDAAARFLGARRGEAVAEGRIRQAIDRAILHRMAEDREVELYTPRRRVLRLTALPLEHGVESLGAVVYITDMTEERRVEAMRRDFIANVSHELKTPLGALAVLAETLAAQVGDSEVAARLAGRLGTEATRLSRLLEDILDLSQAEALGGAGFQPVAIEDLLKDIAPPAVVGADGLGVDLQIVSAPKEAIVRGDRRQLRAVLLNLIDNAVKYSDPDPDGALPVVTVRTLVEATEVILEVEDEGIGIPEGHIDRIFERFYRVDRARSRETGGTGLGLSIVRNVAVNHGGTVEVESQLGHGSTFRVRLPRWREQ
jgi:two-component system sensor histidine kinase SenX3